MGIGGKDRGDAWSRFVRIRPGVRDILFATHLDVHLVCDNYATHKSPAIRRWLEQHPWFRMHYTPTYSSWINKVERWFVYLTDDLLRRSDHRSVQALEKDIRNWVTALNESSKPFIWTKTAEQMLQSLSRLLQRINGAGL
jgi:transposase